MKGDECADFARYRCFSYNKLQRKVMNVQILQDIDDLVTISYNER